MSELEPHRELARLAHERAELVQGRIPADLNMGELVRLRVIDEQIKRWEAELLK